MRAVLSIWSWTAIVLTIVVGFFVLVLLSPTMIFDRRRIVVGRAFRLSSVGVARLLPQWNFRVQGEIPARPGPRTVCVSNHRSQSDPFLISHLPWEMKWVAKASLFEVPFLGWSMRLAGDIPVDRGDRASGRDALARAAEWIARGVPVMIFPEGTRSRDGRMLPFKSGAFRLAIETGADVLPLAVTGTETALPKRDWKLGNAQARVMVGRPISTAGLTQDDAPRLEAEARARIEALLGLPHEAAVPAGPPLATRPVSP